MSTITLNQLAVALLGAGAYIYHCTSRGGYWKACAIICGCHVERDSPDPYQAIAQVAQVLISADAEQAAQDARDTPQARAAYRSAWAESEGLPLYDRHRAAEAAAAAASAPPPPASCFACGGTGIDYHMADCCQTCGGSGVEQFSTEQSDAWPSTIRTEQDSARAMQRLASITGRPSAADFYSQAEEPAAPNIGQSKKEKAEAKRKELIEWLAKNGGRQKWQVCRINIPDHLQGVINGMVEAGELIREYKTGRGFLGRYKRCYIRLKPKQKS